MSLPGRLFPRRRRILRAVLLFCLSIWLSSSEEIVQIDSPSNELKPYKDGNSVHSFSSPVANSFREFSVGKGEKGLFPSIFNLATHAEIRATATCGHHGPDFYCKLVEHVFMRQPQCDICDANNHHKNHPIDYAIDGTKRWWQSPTLSNGLSYEKLNITLDLRQEYQVAYVIMKAAISPRPGTWVLEKSLDGFSFVPWQYFASSDSECMRVFGVPASTGVPKFSRDDEVICTSHFSKLNPLEYGEIHISLVNGRPGAEKSSQEMQLFTKTRFVRLRLLGLKTLYADLMVINQRDKKLDHSVTRRYFYTISDISIGGQCICYGHAERCAPDVVHGQFRCECRHKTCGESCSECCPLHNQLPWRIGTHDHPNVCQPCQCFNHAFRCEYDQEIEAQRLSVTPEGIYEGGGRCVECQHNTVGINCEKCKPEFYRPTNVSHYRIDACRPCDCDLVGSESNGCVRDETEATEKLRAGDCRCKPGFGGRRCERCALGFRNHPACEPCPCDRSGSLNFDTCEEDQCVCKRNVEGQHCDRCKAGTIHLDREDPEGCQPCFCFGKSTECREFTWDTAQVGLELGNAIQMGPWESDGPTKNGRDQKNCDVKFEQFILFASKFLEYREDFDGLSWLEQLFLFISRPFRLSLSLISRRRSWRRAVVAGAVSSVATGFPFSARMSRLSWRPGLPVISRGSLSSRVSCLSGLAGLSGTSGLAVGSWRTGRSLLGWAFCDLSGLSGSSWLAGSSGLTIRSGRSRRSRRSLAASSSRGSSLSGVSRSSRWTGGSGLSVMARLTSGLASAARTGLARCLCVRSGLSRSSWLSVSSRRARRSRGTGRAGLRDSATTTAATSSAPSACSTASAHPSASARPSSCTASASANCSTASARPCSCTACARPCSCTACARPSSCTASASANCSAASAGPSSCSATASILTNATVLAEVDGTRLANSASEVGKHLGASHLSPNVAGSHFAEVQFVLHLRAQLLEVLVGQRDGNDADESGNGRKAHSEEGQRAKRLRLVALPLLVVIGRIH